MKSLLLFFVLVFINISLVHSQVSKNLSTWVSTTANPNGTLKFNWTPRATTVNTVIYKKNINGKNWSNYLGGVAAPNGEYIDANAKIGEANEYYFVEINNQNQGISISYLYAGNQFVPDYFKGNVLLLIDSNYIEPLADEIERLEVDLVAEGWNVFKHYAGRSQTPMQVKNEIIAMNELKEMNLRSVLIIGHVPVPYSGGFGTVASGYPPPDGHGDHHGAWAADGYYGDLYNIWTDQTINVTTGQPARNQNIPDDGKFDQTKFPDSVRFEVGRIDLYNMPLFSSNDTMLVKNYLDRNHEYRTGNRKVTKRALIDDNFGNFTIAATGFHNFSTLIQHDSIFDNRNYLTSQWEEDYLFSYGCGGGSYTSCAGVGLSKDFVEKPVENVFTILAGSYFGDWDVSNSFLRAPLANKSLISFWGGIPKWYIQHMAMGETIGFGAKISMNNTSLYFNGNFNSSSNSVHMGLMGDPTLRMEYLMPPKGLNVVSNNLKVDLTWESSPDQIDGYHIFRSLENENNYTRITDEPITSNNFTDNTNAFDGSYRYVVCATKLTTNPSGSYYQLSGSTNAVVWHEPVSVNENNEFTLSLYPNPTTDRVMVEFSNPDSNIEIELTDLTGNVLHKQSKNKFTSSNATILNLENYSKGVYLLRILNGSKLVKVEKIIRY